MYDLIGDIHGYATELKKLLTLMGYQEKSGVWRHPHRKVIFLGDFVDRGPEQVELLEMVRAMVDQGSALAVMGNHEYNAVAWATPFPDKDGEFLRPHIAKYRHQHKEFLRQVGEGSELHHSSIEWFKTLPTFLDLPELRVIHACWHSEQIRAFEPFLDAENRLLEDAWVPSAQKGTTVHTCVDILLKGLEIDLPPGCEILDKDNSPYGPIRLQWWREGEGTYRDLAITREDISEFLPDSPIPPNVLFGYDREKPVFIGHYWLKGRPKPLTPYVACLDYSVAGKQGGKLVAYRFDGEKKLTPDNFVWVDRQLI